MKKYLKCTGCPTKNGVSLPLVNRNNSEYLNELRVQKQSLGLELLADDFKLADVKWHGDLSCGNQYCFRVI